MPTITGPKQQCQQFHHGRKCRPRHPMHKNELKPPLRIQQKGFAVRMTRVYAKGSIQAFERVGEKNKPGRRHASPRL